MIFLLLLNKKPRKKFKIILSNYQNKIKKQFKEYITRYYL